MEIFQSNIDRNRSKSSAHSTWLCLMHMLWLQETEKTSWKFKNTNFPHQTSTFVVDKVLLSVFCKSTNQTIKIFLFVKVEFELTNRIKQRRKVDGRDRFFTSISPFHIWWRKYYFLFSCFHVRSCCCFWWRTLRRRKVNGWKQNVDMRESEKQQHFLDSMAETFYDERHNMLHNLILIWYVWGVSLLFPSPHTLNDSFHTHRSIAFRSSFETNKDSSEISASHSVHARRRGESHHGMKRMRLKWEIIRCSLAALR